MSSSKESKKRGSLLEFTLPNAILEAVSANLGRRTLGMLTQEERSKVVGACNVAAEEIAEIVGSAKKAKAAAAPAAE